MTRTPQEVFSAHLAALAKRDVSLILQDFADDAIVISSQGALEGLAGVEAFYTAALGGLPDIDITVTSSVFGWGRPTGAVDRKSLGRGDQ